ncbi:hypothetical protein OQA88_2022 [Cercophora sp. LCS_1]
MDPDKIRKVYPYRLKPGELRIVEIHPGEWDELARCTLRRYVLDDPSRPDYTALSYAWGSMHLTDAIILNGEPWNATMNMCGALDFLRDRKDGVRLWVDAVVV